MEILPFWTGMALSLARFIHEIRDSIAAEPDFMRSQRQFRAPRKDDSVSSGVLVPLVAELYFHWLGQDAAQLSRIGIPKVSE